MKLNILKAENEITAVSMVSLGYINVLYDFDMPVKILFDKIKSQLENSLLEDKKDINSDCDICDEEKLSYFNIINDIINKIDNKDEFFKCFEKIEITVEDVDTLENIYKIINDIKIPIVLNVCFISEDYILKNLGRIDSVLKNTHRTKISYVINQCLTDNEAHYEDNSYTFEEVMLVLTSIRKITGLIKKFDLSPLEQVMFIYDYVKDRYYNASSDDESYIESRDVAKILASDKIVCLGFATLFKSLLDNLGIANDIVMLSDVNNNRSGHSRNMVVISDSKYNLDHILYFDVTWDCKRNDNLIDEDKYEYFGRERIYFVKRENGLLNEYGMLPYCLRKDNDYSFLFNSDCSVSKKLIQIRRLFRKINWKEYIINNDISKENIEKFEYMMSDDLRAVCVLADDHDFCIFAYKECCKMMNRKITDDTFFKCLYTVRRVENYLNPDKYSFNQDVLMDIYYNRTIPKATDEQKFLFGTLMGYDRCLIKIIDEIDEMDKENNRKILLDRLVILNDNINASEIDSSVLVKDAIKLLKK